jgi:hypothetical protein
MLCAIGWDFTLEASSTSCATKPPITATIGGTSPLASQFGQHLFVQFFLTTCSLRNLLGERDQGLCVMRVSGSR